MVLSDVERPLSTAHRRPAAGQHFDSLQQTLSTDGCDSPWTAPESGQTEAWRHNRRAKACASLHHDRLKPDFHVCFIRRLIAACCQRVKLQAGACRCEGMAVCLAKVPGTGTCACRQKQAAAKTMLSHKTQDEED